MKQTLFLISILLPSLLGAQAADCEAADCPCILKKAHSALSGKDYEATIALFQAYKVCNSDRAGYADSMGLAVFQTIEREKRAAYANDLAYKAQLALLDGDRTTAFRLAALAHRYVDDNNSNVQRVLLEAFYYNASSDPLHRLPWKYTFEGHKDGIYSVAFSPDGKRLATGSSDNTVKIWDLSSGKAEFTLEGHTGDIRSVSFSPNGKTLATGSSDETVKIWDLESREVLFTLEGHTNYVLSIAFSPNGKRLATGSSDKTVKIWDLTSGKAVFALESHTDNVLSVSFSPDGNKLAIGSSDNTAKIWDLENKNAVFSLEGHTDEIKSVCFSPDGKKLATGSLDNTAKIWDTESGKMVFSLEGHRGTVWSVAFSPDEQKLATGSSDKTVKIWDLTSGKAVFAFDDHQGAILSVSFSPNGKRLATGSLDKTAKIWDLGSGKEALTLKGHQGDVWSIAFSPDGKRLATSSSDETAKIWDIASGATIFTLKGHQGDVMSAAFSPDGKRLATGASDKTVKIWDLTNGKAIFTLDGHKGSVLSVAFSPDGKKLGTGSSDNTAKIWDLENEEAMFTLKGHAGTIWSVSFSPDGKKLGTGSSDNTAKIWELEDKKAVFTFDNYTSVLSVAFSPDGEKLATTGASDNTAKIWDLRSGKLAFSLDGHTDDVLSIAFSPDNKRMATGSLDKTVRIWDLESRKAAYTFEGHTGDVLSVVFSPDGKRLATSASDTTAKIWLLDPDEFIAQTQREHRLDHLNLAQLKKYGLENLPNARPGGEDLLCGSGETAQIAIFADLYADRTRRQNELARTEDDYNRATRLYACASKGQDSVSLAKLAQIWREWSFAYLVEGLPDSALQLALRAERLAPTNSEVRKQLALAFLAQPNSALGTDRFGRAIAMLLSLAENSRNELLANFETLKNQRVILPGANDALRLLIFNGLDSKASTNYSIFLPPNAGTEEDMLAQLPDTVALLYHIRKLEYTAFLSEKQSTRARQWEEIAAVYAQLATRTGNLAYAIAERKALLEAAREWRNAGSEKDTTLAVREQFLNKSFELFHRLKNILENSATNTLLEHENILKNIIWAGDRRQNLLFEQKRFSEMVVNAKMRLETNKALIQLVPKERGYQKLWMRELISQLSWCYLLNRQPVEALQTAELALRYDSLSARAEGYLAHALLCNDQIVEARRHYLSAALEKESGELLSHQFARELTQLDTTSWPGVGKRFLPLLQSGGDTLLTEAVLAGIPKAQQKWNARLLESARTLKEKVDTAAQNLDFRTATDTSLAYIAVCRALFVADSTLENRERLGFALGKYSFYLCFSGRPELAVSAARESCSLLHLNWPRKNLAHGYLLSGRWKKAKVEYRTIKDLDDDSGEHIGKKLGDTVWTDFQTFARAGIRQQKLQAAAELILGRSLLKREKDNF